MTISSNVRVNVMKVMNVSATMTIKVNVIAAIAIAVQVIAAIASSSEVKVKVMMVCATVANGEKSTTAHVDSGKNSLLSYSSVHIDKIERIHRQAARFITGDCRSRDEGCVSSMLKTLELQSLQDRRKTNRLTFLYKPYLVMTY
ncbi:hypothetical protein DPMN_090933 [Dreissena polymorpha]|uniref:Uncharacterized protein n=1 Tax=Dreissena polymorpha TaxID=45954 RepID=A0A9D4KYZ6_DREPO|nr:hypothetical protein DPMN_090933 [Dreissena polymorpha]